MAHDVFISYSSEDKPVADAVSAALEAKHVRCWVAPRDVLPGRDYAEQLIKAISDAALMVLVFSSRSNNSPHVVREVERAASRAIPILPFRVEHVAPSAAMEYYISSTHWLDAITPPLERHLEHLTDTVQLLLARDGSAASPGVEPVARVHTPITVTASRAETVKTPPPRGTVEGSRRWYRRPLGLVGLGAGAMVVIAAIVFAVMLYGGGKAGGTDGGTTVSSSISAAAMAESSHTTGLPATTNDLATTTTITEVTTTSSSTTSSTTTSSSTTTTTQAVVTPGTVLYDKSEWTPSADGWTKMGQWKIVDGMLVSDGTQQSISVAPVTLGTLTDYAVEAEMQVIDPSKGSFYLEARLINGEGYWGGYKGGYYKSDCSVRAGFASEMLSSAKYVDDGNWHTYRLEVYGNSIRLLFDGAEVVRATDNRQLEAGTVGIYASGQMNVRAFRVVAL